VPGVGVVETDAASMEVLHCLPATTQVGGEGGLGFRDSSI